MAFAAEIVFTGVCGIVPKVNPVPPPRQQTSPGGFCVVLPNAWKADPLAMRLSLDQISRLRRHTAFVRFTTHPLDVMDRRQNLEGLWFLKGHRLVVTPTFEGPSPTIGPQWGNIAGLASFEDVVSINKQDLVSVNKAVTAPKPKRIAAQVVVHDGTLSSSPLEAEWVFESFLRPEEPLVIKRLNYQVSVTLENLEKLTVVQQSLRGRPTGRCFTFSKGPAFVTVANLCDQNPLQWGHEPPVATMPDDDDFRWHYEIVDEPDKLSEALAPLRCPIPRLTRVPIPRAHGFIGGGGLNCVPIRFPAVDFSF